MIHYRQRITTAAIAHLELPLVVGAPQFVGRTGCSRAMGRGLHPPPAPFRLHHAFPLQHVVDAGLRWNGLIWKAPGEERLYLLRAERIALPAAQGNQLLPMSLY